MYTESQSGRQCSDHRHQLKGISMSLSNPMHHARPRQAPQPITLAKIIRKTELQARAKRLREKLEKPADPLDDFNYVGSRHHY